MRRTENHQASKIVLQSIRKSLAEVEAGISRYHTDPSLREDLDESIRRTRVAKCATAIIGSATLNRMLSCQEDILESVISERRELDHETLSLLTTMVAATTSLVDAQEATSSPTDVALNASRDQIITSLKAYRRYRDLPAAEDDVVISEMLRSSSGSFGGFTAPYGIVSTDSRTTDSRTTDTDVSVATEHPASGEASPAEAIAPELLAIFQEEAEDHINKIYAGLSALKADPSCREQLQEVRRAAHTLKGAAGAVGLRDISKLSHRMEDVLDALYEGHMQLSEQQLPLLLETTDFLQDACFGDDSGAQADKLQGLYSAYGELLGGGTETAPQSGSGRSPASEPDPSDSTGNASKPSHNLRTLRVPSQRLDDVRNVVSELMINRTSLEQNVELFASSIGDLQAVYDRLRSVSHQLETQYEVPALWTKSSPYATWTTGNAKLIPRQDDRAEFDDLELDRYTDFHLTSRSLAETTSDCGAISHELRTLLGNCESLLAQQNRLTRDMHARLLQIRMVPFDAISTRLERVLREVADRQGKPVELVIEGRHTELDKTVLEELVDPLLHLLRNSVDHGVEPTEERVANGKPATATVTVSADLHGTHVVLRVSDDGKGLDADKIRAGVVQGGFLDAAQAKELAPKQLFPYIFVPGFSTASQVSEISGRGVGMDIVRSNIDKLKGSIDVESQPGRGTAFTIHLPTTLVVTRALIAKTHRATFAIPTHAVAKIRKVESERVVQHGDELAVMVDGVEYELVRLDSHLEFAPVSQPPEETPTVAIVRLGDRHVALTFDTILSTRDIVVKSLGTHLKTVRGLLGVTVLGDGAVVPILDPSGLALSHESRLPPSTQLDGEWDDDVSVMVVDDSVSVRRALSSLIERAQWTPVAARDGADALKKLADLKYPPHVVLLDVEMPRMDGYELLGILRSRPEFVHTPIIMITSRSGDKHRQKAMELGATAYVVKPFQDEPLLQLLRRHIAQSNRQQP